MKTVCYILMDLYFKPHCKTQRFVFASPKPAEEIARKKHRGTKSSNPLMLWEPGTWETCLPVHRSLP